MANLDNYWFYHGTTLENARSIIKNGFKISSKVGSLGRGAYAFANIEDEAKTFALRKCKYTNYKLTPCVIRFKLKPNSLVLDFTKPSTIIFYEHYTEISRRSLLSIRQRHNNKNRVKKLDGYVLDNFVNYIYNRIGKKPLGIYNLTQNDLRGEIVPYSQIPNSMELNIKNDSIVDTNRISMIKLS